MSNGDDLKAKIELDKIAAKLAAQEQSNSAKKSLKEGKMDEGKRAQQILNPPIKTKPKDK